MKILFLMAVAMFAASIAFGYMFLSFAESGDFRNKDTAMIGMYATRTVGICLLVVAFVSRIFGRL